MNPPRPASTRPVSQTSSRSRITCLQHPLHQQHQPPDRQTGPAQITAPPSSSAAQSAVSRPSPSSLASNYVTGSNSIITSQQTSSSHARKWTTTSEASSKTSLSRKWTTSKLSSRKSAPRINIAGSCPRETTNRLRCGVQPNARALLVSRRRQISGKLLTRTNGDGRFFFLRWKMSRRRRVHRKRFQPQRSLCPRYSPPPPQTRADLFMMKNEEDFSQPIQTHHYATGGVPHFSPEQRIPHSIS